MRTYRLGSTRYVAYASCAAVVVVAVAIVAGLPQAVRDQVNLAQALTLLGVLVGVLVTLLGVGRSRVRFDDQQIEVLNGFRRRVFPWSQVRGFAMPVGAQWPTMVTIEDDRISLLGIQDRDALNELVEELARRTR